MRLAWALVLLSSIACAESTSLEIRWCQPERAVRILSRWLPEMIVTTLPGQLGCEGSAQDLGIAKRLLEFMEEDAQQQAPFQALALPLPAGARVTLLAVTPSRDSAGFHGYRVLRRKVLDSYDQRAVMDAVWKGLDEGLGQGRLCFEPHHGLHIEANGHCYDLLICYHCLLVRGFIDDERRQRQFGITPESASVLNPILGPGRR